MKVLLSLAVFFVAFTSAICWAQPSASSIKPPSSINECLQKKVAVIVPTEEKTKESCARIRAYAESFWKDRALLLDDTAALKQDLSDYAIVTYGTLTGNLWTKQNLTNWPITITRDAVTTDRQFKGTDLRVIACWRTPGNPGQPWVLYTAQDSDGIVGINSVFHGPAQFDVARGTTVLQSGYYARRNGAWVAGAAPDFEFPALTRQQMLEDYDKLASIINQVFPLMRINKQLYGVDVSRLLAANRKEIGKITQTAQFVDLINRTIVGCRGSHFWIAPGRQTYYQGFVANDAYELAPSYERYVKGREGNGLELPLLYFSGSYYIASDFTCRGRTFPRGMKVLTCNGKRPDVIVKGLERSGVVLDWDYDLKKFYTTGFYKYVPLGTSNSVLSFELKGTNGRAMALQLGGGERAKWQAQEHLSGTPQVTLINTNILYIRLAAMDPKQLPFYREELKKYQGKTIKKVVIDIRNNGGGSDETWSTLLSLLLKQKMPVSIALAAKVSGINSNYLARHAFGKKLAEEGKVEHIPFLDNEEFRVLRMSGDGEPDADSLKLECTIFVLSENVYSSAGSLMNFCRQSKQLVSVGLPNSMILGMGIDPFAFSLPNSKIVFWLEPVVDLTDARNARDTHHNDVEVRIRPSLEQLLDYYGTGNEMPLDERLNKHDPFFKRVLEMD